MLVKELIEHLQKHYSLDETIAYDLWSKEDIQLKADEKGVVLSDEQINDALDYINDHKDSELGITWITIDCAIDNVVDETEDDENTSLEDLLI